MPGIATTCRMTFFVGQIMLFTLPICAGDEDCCAGTWMGVNCSTVVGSALVWDNTLVVTGLSLTALGLQAKGATSLPLLDVVAAVSRMTHLQSLLLSNINISGAEQEPSRPGL
jgi:hypothetical protein